MVHSGINTYLTLHVAETLLRAGDKRFFNLIKSTAGLATETGQWPEAIHPATKGGCMGDGQQVWASAEWVILLRNCFIREEAAGKNLILCSGIPEEWHSSGTPFSFGPAPTSSGEVSVHIYPGKEKEKVSWQASLRRETPNIEIRLPGFKTVTVSPGQTSAEIIRK